MFKEIPKVDDLYLFKNTIGQYTVKVLGIIPEADRFSIAVKVVDGPAEMKGLEYYEHPEMLRYIKLTEIAILLYT